MFLKQFRFFAFWAFIIGLVAIVFLQFISSQNIKRLIRGNNSLLHELTVQKQLRNLQSDILTIESDVRGAIINNDSIYLRNVNAKVSAVQSETKTIEQLINANDTHEAQELKSLVDQKLDFNKIVLQTFLTQGPAVAQKLIQSNRGQILRDRIINLISVIESKRQQDLKNIIGSNEHSGTQAKTWGIVLSAFACLFIAIAFSLVLQQARQQQKMIDALNESERKTREAAKLKEQFVANMSHEIRTPMNAILGFTGLLRQTNLTDEQKQYIQSMHSASENLLVLINDILDLSKIEAGMMNLEVTKFSLRSLVASVGAMFYEKSKEKRLRLYTHIDEEIPDILNGDALRLTQILVNLLSNAVKFTEKGRITVKIHLIKNTGTHADVKICIADTGIGIAPEKQHTIFERFHQAEAETTRRFGGTGLGLAIVKQLIDLQQGKLSIKSELHKGTEFIIQLRYKLPDMELLFSEAMAAESETISLQKIRALIAEDNQMNQHLIAHLMKSWSIEYTIVSNGIEAVRELNKGGYSIVLMDIQMPEMDGYTATGIIRKELGKDIPIIAMTAHAMAGEREKCLRLGMNDYVSKPIKETVLYNIIARHAQHSPENAGLSLTPLSLEYLHQLSGNDPEFEKQILRQFVIQVPEELSHLERAIAQKDFTGIRRIAHSMKSTVGYVGLSDELQPVLSRMEAQGETEDPNGLGADFEWINKKCMTAVNQIEQILKEE